jgi:hypothetical protein
MFPQHLCERERERGGGGLINHHPQIFNFLGSQRQECAPELTRNGDHLCDCVSGSGGERNGGRDYSVLFSCLVRIIYWP